MRLRIDGWLAKAQEGSTLLDVAKEQDILIPTLCYYEEVSPGGRCGLCKVEILSKEGHPALVLACVYPAKNGLEISTFSKRVIAARKEAMKLLFAQAPLAPRIQEMARTIGLKIPTSRLKGTGCIGCGLCVRACREIVGRNAITLVHGQGQLRETVSIEPDPERCIACGTCVFLCPTGFIQMEDFGDSKRIWGRIYRDRGSSHHGRVFYPQPALNFNHPHHDTSIRG